MEQVSADSRNTWIPAALAAVLAMLTFLVAVRGTYIYDDYDILLNDERIKSIGQIHRYWTERYHDGVDNLYRPITSSTYAIEYWLHGDRAWAFHLVNVLLHAGVSALVARLGQKLWGDRVGMIAGVLYAVHPVHVEAVANIVGRAELLCAMGFVGSMVLILRNPFRARDAVGVIVCAVLALLSKEQGMLLPPLLATLWWCVRRKGCQQQEATRIKGAIASICILLAAYVVLREQVLGMKFWWDRNFLDWTINPLVREDADNMLMPLVLLGRYAGLLFAPIKLSPDYGATVIGWQVQWNEPWFYLGVASLLIWIALFIQAAKRRDGVLLFCLIALGVTYGIVGNVVSLIGVNLAERLMYLPSVFFVMIIASWLARFRAGVAVTVVLISLFLLRSVTYAAQWNEALSFYSYCVEHQPNSIRLHMLLVAEYRSLGQLENARLAAEKARAVLPDYDEIYVQSAFVAISQHDYDAADEFLDQALSIASKDKRRSLLKAAGWKAKVAELRAATQPATQVR
jgi:hypothetical protein